MATQAELLKDLQDLTAQATKIGTEITTLQDRFTELEAALQNAGNLTPEAEAALAALKSQMKVVDDLIPDTST